MITDIEQIIQQKVFQFLEETAKEFDLPITDLKKNWLAFVQHPKSLTKPPPVCEDSSGIPVDKKKAPSKKSTYQNFFTQKRVELKKENPSLSFGDLSKQISKIWNSMDKEQQAVYQTVTEPTVEPVGATLPPGIPHVEILPSSQELNAMKMLDLKKLCEERGLKRTGNKNDLIKSLLYSTSEPTKPTVPVTLPTLVSTVIENDNEDVEVIASSSIKRADIEEEVELSEEEQDFDFDEEDQVGDDDFDLEGDDFDT